MKRQLFLFLACIIVLFSCTNSGVQTDNQYVVVLSMDGFRWDYPNIASTPNLDFIAAHGVKAERLIPCFPTKTFPNHYSLATGLYVDNHGIVLNNFHSPEFGQDYNKGNRATVEDAKFYDGEPIWVTAEKQGVRTASYFWVGSEADIDGISPTYQKMYDHRFPYSQRIDSVLHWLGLPEDQRPQLIMWYMDEPDGSGHRYGPQNDTLKPIISQMDSLVGVFMKAMLELPHAGQINFIVLSDHGMTQLSPDKSVILDEYVDTAKIAIIDGWNPNFNLKVKEGYLEEVYDSLRKIEHLKVWKSEEVPERLHYGKNQRTHDLVLVAETGWSIYWSWAVGSESGAHGFDNESTDMHAIFYAMGPAFKKGYIAEPIPNIDVYPLIAKLLNIKPAEVDGQFERVEQFLKD